MKTWRVILLATLIVSMPLLLCGQQDPLGTAQPGVVKAKTELDKFYKDRELKASAKVLQRLKDAQTEVTNKKLTFQVGATEALEREPGQLLGILRPKEVKMDAIKLQDEMNKKIMEKAKIEMKEKKIREPNTALPAVSAVPSCYMNWAYVTPVKDQKNCGSCWAFAAAGAYEHTYKKFYNATVDMSEQSLIDCGATASGSDAGSCAGGWTSSALDHIRAKGTSAESVYPYLTHMPTCAMTKSCQPCQTTKPKSLWSYCWNQLYPNRWPTVAEIKAYVYAYGAVATYMKAGIPTFFAYKNGVYNGYNNTNPYDIDHAVVIVGWCDALNAWIIKNSWGTGWGYSGYGYVNYNNCNIGKFVFYTYPRYSSGPITSPISAEPSPITK